MGDLIHMRDWLEARVVPMGCRACEHVWAVVPGEEDPWTCPRCGWLWAVDLSDTYAPRVHQDPAEGGGWLVGLDERVSA